MPAPRPTYRKLTESVRHRLDVATAMAWEALVDAHIEQAREFIALFEDRFELEESIARYVREMDMADTMATAVRTRVLVMLEDETNNRLEEPVPIRGDDDDSAAAVPGAGDEYRWKRFRPDVVMRGVLDRQRKNEETDRLIELAIARAEEQIIKTHVDNAITFAALLEDSATLSRGVGHYLSALHVTGSRGQTVLQRTMARLADVHLPRKQ